MQSGIQGLGWFMRRTRDPYALASFYSKALGLPRLRSWQTEELCGAMLWVGGVGVLETNLLNAGATCKPQHTQCIPVFRSGDLVASRERLEKAGLLPTNTEQDRRSTTAFFCDIDGLPFGVEALHRDDLNPVDKHWTRRIEAGDDALPGGIRIDGDIAGLSRIIHKTPDTGAEVALLQNLGLCKIPSWNSGPALSIGDTCLVELRKSDVMLPPVTERDMLHDAWIMRVYGMEPIRERFGAAGGTYLSQHDFPGGMLDYTLTPSNRIVGWQERKSYDPDVPTTQMVEDLDARSRWLRS